MSRISRRKNIRFLIWSLVLLSLLAFIVTSYDVYGGVIKFSNEPLKETKLGNRIKRPNLSDNSSNAKANEDNKDQKQSAKSSDKNGGKESEAKDSGDKAKQSSQKAKANEKNNAKEKPQKSQNAAKPDSPKKTQKSGKIEKEEKVEATDKAEKSPAKNADKQNDDKSEKLEENASKYKSTPRPKLPAKPTEKEEGSAQDQKGSKDAVSDFMNEKFGDHSNDPKNPNMFLGDTEPNEGSTYDEDDEDKDDEADKDADKDEYNEADNEAPHIHESEQEGTLGSGIVPDSPLKPVTIKEKPFAEVPEKFDEIQPLNFRVYSHNVKNGGHDILVSGERTWAERVNEIASSIAFNARHDAIVALQEVYKFQLDNLLSELNRYSPQNQPEWAAYGAGRIDGRNIGEYVPVLYKTSEWELVFSDTMWLNEKNPRTSLEGWDAKYLRICSYVTLKHKRTENYFNVFNTHFDHVGELSRIGSASMIVQKMNEINKWPSIFCGDLNAEPTERTYQLIVEDYKDVSRLTTAFNRYGHSKSSVTGFGGEVLLQGGQNIDYIFAPGYTTKINQEDVCDAQSRPEDSPEANLSLKLQAFAMLHSKFNGAYMSDHRPLVADFILENKCK
mmetsp:Transcript_4422/g.4881  ORF Transcript_4422/g.4881 Transcript_4422/m.4881 type:complete len:614 (+) Transcript_4422:161-2002(+)